MGINNSTRRRRNRMSDDTSQGGAQDEETGELSQQRAENSDLASVLAHLIRSGQVRILASESLSFGDEDDEYDGDISDYVGPANPPMVEVNPDTSALDVSEFKQEILLNGGVYGNGPRCSIARLLAKREGGVFSREQFSPGTQSLISCNYLPTRMHEIEHFHQKAFCGVYSTHGNIFLSACQDQKIRIYDTSLGQFRMFKSICARDVGWSVLDTAFSPDGNYMIYSSWSSAIHLCNIYGEHETHTALPICPQGNYSFCIFSLTFSLDNSEILGGANDGCLYVYDREKNERTLRIESHEDDVNAVSFADASSQILFSGGDDGLIKVWDRRMLSEAHPAPVGILAGHMDGITFIDSKGDGRYLLSNCKDQSIKLWDMRRFSDRTAQEETLREVSRQNWDYRWQQVPVRVAHRKKRLAGDSSLMTYRGHSVLHTLVRARFSPAFTTGQKYIYSGCATGAVVIYDVLTGQIVKHLRGHSGCVRDVSWHPYEHKIISTSWDGSIGLWEYKKDDSDAEKDRPSDSSDFTTDSDDDSSFPRRSRRLRKRRRSGRRPYQSQSLRF